MPNDMNAFFHNDVNLAYWYHEKDISVRAE